MFEEPLLIGMLLTPCVCCSAVHLPLPARERHALTLLSSSSPFALLTRRRQNFATTPGGLQQEQQRPKSSRPQRENKQGITRSERPISELLHGALCSVTKFDWIPSLVLGVRFVPSPSVEHTVYLAANYTAIGPTTTTRATTSTNST